MGTDGGQRGRGHGGTGKMGEIQREFLVFRLYTCQSLHFLSTFQAFICLLLIYFLCPCHFYRAFPLPPTSHSFTFKWVPYRLLHSFLLLFLFSRWDNEATNTYHLILYIHITGTFIYPSPGLFSLFFDNKVFKSYLDNENFMCKKIFHSPTVILHCLRNIH